MSAKVQRFEANTVGRDFVIGDIHGCFEQLKAQMRRVQFNPKNDRLFSVGDLVDRGPSSMDAVNWIARPWFHAVRGNHEDMAIQYACGRWPEDNYRRNGGAWLIDLPISVQQAIAQAFLTLPLAIEVQTPTGLVGIVHAEPCGTDWQEFTGQLEVGESDAVEVALWSRVRINRGNQAEVTGVRTVYVGHTPVETPLSLGNVLYIDTGAVFGNPLTMLQFSGSRDGLQIATEELGYGN